MRAIVMRHGKVDFQWKKWSTSEQFEKECKRYDEAPVVDLASEISRFEYQDIYISSLQRSRETATQLFGEKNFISTKLLDEVPLCAGIISNKKLPLIFWNISARLQWFFNIYTQKECRKETVYRAEQFINMIAEIADAFISFWRTMLLIRLADDCNFIRAGTDQVNEYVSKGL